MSTGGTRFLLLLLFCWEAVGPARAAVFQEDFDRPPLAAGWRTFGEGSLFSWSEASRCLEVTWDSGRSNSFFYRPLGTTLTRHDDFDLTFDLRLADARIGLDPGKPYTFELAVGLIHLASATSRDFVRGKRNGTRNIVEFDYFPDFAEFGATVAATVVSSNSLFRYSHNFPLELPAGDLFRITLRYASQSQVLSTGITRNGEPFQPIEAVVLEAAFSDFQVDAFAISSYSDAQSDGSLLAHGTIDRILLTLPDPPVRALVGSFTHLGWQVAFASQTNWVYALERSVDLGSWAVLSPTLAGNGAQLVLPDSAPPPGQSFYRIRAQRP